MTGTSHAVTGAVVAAVLKEPAVALPAAFLSHFICDALPHVGVEHIKDKAARNRAANRLYAIDLLLILLVFGVLFALDAPWFVIAGAFLAGSPDFVWFYRYILREKIGKKPPGPKNMINRFHSRIQWSETLRYGIPVEIIYSGLAAAILLRAL